MKSAPSSSRCLGMYPYFLSKIHVFYLVLRQRPQSETSAKYYYFFRALLQGCVGRDAKRESFAYV